MNQTQSLTAEDILIAAKLSYFRYTLERYEESLDTPTEIYVTLEALYDVLVGLKHILPHVLENRISTKELLMAKNPKLGSGKRFEAVEKKARASGAKNPAAVAAAVGRAKYGSKRMAKMSAAGRKKG